MGVVGTSGCARSSSLGYAALNLLLDAAHGAPRLAASPCPLLSASSPASPPPARPTWATTSAPSGPPSQASRRAGTENFYFLADYHALIKCDEPARMQRSTLEIAACWLAVGLDPERVLFYRQSDIPEIPELTWLLTCVTGKGLLNRAHAYKAVGRQEHRRRQRPGRRRHRGPVHVPGADGRRHPDVQGPQDPGRPRPGAAHRDGARHGAKLQPPVRRAFRAARGGDRRHRGHAARPGRPQDEQELRQHHRRCSRRASRCASRSRGIVTDSRAPGEPKEVEGSALFQIYQAFASTEETGRLRQAYADGIAWGDAKQLLFERIDREIAPMRERYDALIRNPARTREDPAPTAPQRPAPSPRPSWRSCARRSACATWQRAMGKAASRQGRQGCAALLQAVPRSRRAPLLQAGGCRRPAAGPKRRLRRPAGRGAGGGPAQTRRPGQRAPGAAAGRQGVSRADVASGPGTAGPGAGPLNLAGAPEGGAPPFGVILLSYDR